jgi:hypothetical protein
MPRRERWGSGARGRQNILWGDGLRAGFVLDQEAAAGLTAGGLGKLAIGTRGEGGCPLFFSGSYLVFGGHSCCLGYGPNGVGGSARSVPRGGWRGLENENSYRPSLFGRVPASVPGEGEGGFVGVAVHLEFQFGSGAGF